ncbi:putative RNA-directed DNA polymerase [Helianthus annuus]|nr:putative RNA-directed DNA polymerase [Helianthus annuus]
MNENTSNNRINGIMVDGVWNTDPTIIQNKAVEFFKERFKEQIGDQPTLVCPSIARLSDEEAKNLVTPFSLLGIKEAVWECDGDKAPGPDGFNFRFMKRCWEGFQGDFLKFFQHFYNYESLNPGCTASFLALIPKVKVPTGLVDFRPISLIGCINKVISKVLVKRLKRVIVKLVSDE